MQEEQVRVAGTAVDQPMLERIFAELATHHMLGIPAGYSPQLERFHATDGCIGSLESVVHDLMAEGSLPRWFKERFVWPRADGLPSQI